MAGSPESDEDSPRGAGTNLLSRLGYYSEAVFELFSDKTLMNKAKSVAITEASRHVQGVASKATDLRKGFSEGVPRQFQGLITKINRQIQTSRRQASLKARRDQPVDVQVGPCLWEDAPQELRSRLWIALLCHPELIGNLVDEKANEERALKRLESAKGDSGSQTPTNELDAKTDSKGHESARPGTQEESSSPTKQLSTGLNLQELSDSLPSGTPNPVLAQSAPNGSKPVLSTAEGQEEKTEATNREGSIAAKSTISIPDASDKDPSSSQGSQVSRGNGSAEEDEGDVWEIVQDNGAWPNNQSSPSLSEQLRRSASVDVQSLKQRLIAAMHDIEWPISVSYQEGCRYDTLCQISVGQEEVEEVIERDIDRTFPEHPQFSFEQGQQQLSRVLKAFSLHDMQVGYCQGMAFVTGVLLMYVPEEPAFRLLARLMDERGANLRHLYLPGLEGLKDYLRMLEWLLLRTNPELKEHLEEHSVVPVLYASQWFLTAFSCPFPPAFACRVIDVMLTENNGNAMLRVAMSVLKACSDDLMQLNDFESLITHLKVEPLKWSQQMTRNVLNEAIQGYISDQMLLAALEAVQSGYDGSLPKVTASRRQAQEEKADESTEENSADKKASEGSAKSTLKNQISGLESAQPSPDLEASAAVASQGDITQAVDAMWTVANNVEPCAETST